MNAQTTAYEAAAARATDLRNNIAGREAALTASLTLLARRVSRAQATIAEGLPLGSSGVVQTLGHEIDAACATLDILREVLRGLEALRDSLA